MKVKFRTNLGSRDASELGLKHTDCLAGETSTVSDKIGDVLVGRGWAVEVDKPAKTAPKPKKVEAVPSKPTIGQAKETTTKSND